MSFVAPGVSSRGAMNPLSWMLRALDPAMIPGSGEGLSIGDVDLSDAKSVQAQVYKFLKAQGFTTAGIAGIMGNVQQESGFRPSVVNSIGAAGLFQWLGPRRNELNKYAASKQKPWIDVKTQMEFMMRELGAREYAGLVKMLRETNDPAQAAIMWEQIFERAGDPMVRVPYAREWYQKIMTNAGFGGGGMVIPALRSGATINYDNTLANLHRGETVLTAPLTQKFKDNMDVASGASMNYTVNVNINKANANQDEIEQAVYGALERKERKLGRTRVIGNRR